MRVAVWDTYVEKADGGLMHFDILVPESVRDQSQVFAFGSEYLLQKGVKKLTITSNECNFCHTEQASDEVQASITKKGYYILEMQGCA